MGRIKAVLAAGAVFLILLISCGEMDSVLPINRTYQISARGEKYSLDEYALLSKNEKIQPFFVHPIINDPDVEGLTITLETPEGTGAGEIIRYVLEDRETSGNEERIDEYADTWTDESGAEAEDEIEILIPLERMDGTLPSFSLPEDLDIGPYIMIFQVLGRNGTLLSKTEKNIYYIADLNYSIKEIVTYLPGISAPSHLIPPGTNVLLEAKINADEDLDPYIVWYNGRIRLGGGKVSSGANLLLWQVPYQNGFQNIRAEVIPFPPMRNRSLSSEAPARYDRMLRGVSMELSLPVSSRGEIRKTLFDYLDSAEKTGDGTILWDYQLRGDLQDYLDPPGENELLRQEDNLREREHGRKPEPKWLPFSSGYGLVIDPKNIYQLPPFIPEIGRTFTFILRFVSLNEGDIFTVSLPGFNNITASFSRDGNFFILVFKTPEGEEQSIVDISLEDDFTVLLLNLTFWEEGLGFSLWEMGDELPRAEKIFRLGEPPPEAPAIFRLGGKGKEEPNAVILDELAVISFEAPPIPVEEPEEEIEAVTDEEIIEVIIPTEELPQIPEDDAPEEKGPELI